MRVVGRVTGRGGCRERGREMGEDNWGRGVVKVHQRISTVGKGRGRGRGEKEGLWGEGQKRNGGGGPQWETCGERDDNVRRGSMKN